MTVNGWIQILLFAAIIFAITKPLGSYMYRVFEGDRQPLPRLFGAIERFALQALRRRSAAAAGLETVRRCDARVQRDHVAGDLRYPAAATNLAVESAEFWTGGRGPRV